MMDARAHEIAQEYRILWLKSPEGYDYLRETVVDVPYRRGVRKSFLLPGKHADGGGPESHTVAIAELAPHARSEYGYFRRRIWWVKSYDRFPGRVPIQNGAYDDITSAPCEAVIVRSIKAGQPSEPWSPDKA